MVSIALVDFGNTLAGQTFFRRDCEQFPTWTAHYIPWCDRGHGLTVAMRTPEDDNL